MKKLHFVSVEQLPFSAVLPIDSIGAVKSISDDGAV
jgi:hypothetical protein